MSKILELTQSLPKQSFAPGAILFAEGKQSGVLCILIAGKVEVLKGEFQVDTISESGAAFGEMSILLNTPHTATVRAVTECQVHWIEDGDAFLKSNKQVAYDFLKVMAQRLSGATSHLTDLNRYVRNI